LKLFGIFEELDQLLHFFFGFFHAGYVFEGNLVFLLIEHAGFAFAEVHGSFARHFDLGAEEEVENDEEEEDRDEADEGGGEEVGLGMDRVDDVFVFEEFFQLAALEGKEDGGAELRHDLRVAGRVGFFVEAFDGFRLASFLHHNGERLFGGRNDAAFFENAQELIVGQLIALAHGTAAEEEGTPDEKEGDGKQNQTAPIDLWVLVRILFALLRVFWRGIGRISHEKKRV
jgi:hypothetical protein